jgi:BA14K-like protein
MQFLVYLTALMVSVSTVLLEVHWLTTPPQQPKPAVQAANVAPVPKVEGPNAALSPVYPKKTESAGSATGAPPATDPSQTQQTQTSTSAAATAGTVESQKPQAETTGMAVRAEDPKPIATAPTRADNPQAPAVQLASAVSNNRCDLEACAGAYKSFRASDCTYQPFGGERRLCIQKTPVAARSAAREPNAEPAATHRSVRDAELRDRELTRRARALRDGGDDDDDRADVGDTERDEPSLFLFGSRGRRW